MMKHSYEKNPKMIEALRNAIYFRCHVRYSYKIFTHQTETGQMGLKAHLKLGVKRIL